MLDGLNKFAVNPVNLDISRSKFDLSHQYKTTGYSGDLIPCLVEEVLPGDTFDLKTSFVCRLITPVVPVMDNAFIDFYYFFVPNRLLFDKWKEFCGENSAGYWAPTSETMLPSYTCSSVVQESILGYMGVPFGKGIRLDNDLPVRAYRLIWNEYFRDQNTQAPIGLPLGSLASDATSGGELCKANKLHDYFTSCLPAPQKGDSVGVAIGNLAPVVPLWDSTNSVLEQNSKNALLNSDAFASSEAYLKWSNVSGDDIPSMVGSGMGVLSPFNSTDGLHYNDASTSLRGATASINPGVSNYVNPVNLWADLSSASLATVNQLRQSFAIQRMLEKQARGGSRYREILKSFFGVSIPDATVQVPEYLGGKRVPINMDTVLQTSETGTSSPLGFTGAFSNTSDSSKSFVKSFVEHGFVIGIAVVRPMQSYSQGLNRMWSRKRIYDYYWPTLANLGEQPVLNKEIFFQNNSTIDNQVFGYQEAWADYRFKASINAGSFSPNSSEYTTFGAWTYGNKFSALPVLNSSFMVQNRDSIGKTLTDTTGIQILLDCWFDLQAVRAMPTYSIPGLIDHH